MQRSTPFSAKSPKNPTQPPSGQPSARHTLRTAPNALLFAILAFCAHVAAKLPEPDAIFFGNVRHNGGALLLPQQTGDYTVIARLNGAIISQAPLTALTSQFVLKVPMDDGIAPRIIGTAKGNDRVRVYLHRTLDNLEQETTESLATNGLLIPTERGTLTEMVAGLSVSGDFGGMAPGFAPFGEWADAFNLSAYPASTDSDGDGQNNLQEFIAGTDPTTSGDTFRILEVRRVNGVSSIKFGPALLSREYSLYCSPDLSGTSWTKIGSVIPTTVVPEQWFDHITPAGTPHLFYRLSVKVQ